MSTLTDTLQKHRDRVVAELRRALSEGDGPYAQVPPKSLTRYLGELFDALLARMRIADHPALAQVLRRELGSGRVPRASALAALLRLAAAMRGILFLELTSRRLAAIASAAIDRATQEATEEMASLLETEAPPPLGRTGAGETQATRDPTIVRHIREVLAAHAGEDVTASILALVLHPHPSARGATRVAAQQRSAAVAAGLIERAGAERLQPAAGVIAAFIPARVDDADATEVVALALELSRQPELTGASIGIARGRLSWPQGSKELAFGGALFEAIAMASTASSGSVLCAPAIYQCTRHSYLMRASRCESLAYAIDPEQPLWLARWEDAALIESSPLVGREAEQATLRVALEDASAPAMLVSLRGRAGVGKQHLLRRTLAELGVGHRRILSGRPHPLAAAPYWPLVGLLRAALGADDAVLKPDVVASLLLDLAGAEPTRQRLRASLPTLHALLCPEADNDGFLDELEPKAVRAGIGLALRLIVEARADEDKAQPLVLVIDEADALDLPTSEALAYLLATYGGHAPLRVVLLHRTAWRRGGSLGRLPVHEVRLGRLSLDALLALVQAMLDQEDLPDELVQLLRGQADGSPMGAEQLVRLLVESGHLQRKGGVWHMRPVDGSTLPRRLTDLVRARIELLPPALVGLLQAAATIGDPIPYPALELAAVSQGIPHDELMGSVSLLGELGFLRGSPNALGFAHPLVREVAYRMQSTDGRRLTHRLAATAVEERYPAARRQMAPVLFRHYLEAGEREEAREVAVEAVQRAAVLHDHKGVFAIVKAALPLCDDDSHDSLAARFDLLLERERIFDLRARRAEQRTDVKELIAIAEQLHDSTRHGKALHRAARLSLLSGESARAITVAGRAVASLAAADRLDLSNALRTQALILWHTRDAAGAKSALERALLIYRDLGHRRGAGFVLHSLGLFALDTGALEQARRYFDQALAEKRATNDTHGEAAVLDALGQVSLHEGDHTNAAASFARSLELLEPGADAASSAQTRIHLGLSVLHSDPERAEHLARTALTELGGQKRGRAEVEARILLAKSLLRQGQRRAATRAASAALKNARAASLRIMLVRALLAHAEVDLSYKGAQRARRAAAVAEEAAALALASGAVRWRVEALSLLAVAQASLEPTQARTAAHEALALLEERTTVGLDTQLVRQRCGEVLRRAASPAGDPSRA